MGRLKVLEEKKEPLPTEGATKVAVVAELAVNAILLLITHSVQYPTEDDCAEVRVPKLAIEDNLLGAETRPLVTVKIIGKIAEESTRGGNYLLAITVSRTYCVTLSVVSFVRTISITGSMIRSYRSMAVSQPAGPYSISRLTRSHSFFG